MRYCCKKIEAIELDDLQDMLSDELCSNNSISSSSSDSSNDSSSSDLDLNFDESDKKEDVKCTVSDQSSGLANAATAVDFDQSAGQ